MRVRVVIAAEGAAPELRQIIGERNRSPVGVRAQTIPSSVEIKLSSAPVF
jgi:hypothetical protein